MRNNVPSNSRHLKLINGWDEWTVVSQQQSNNLESIEIFVAHDRTFTVVIGKLQLGLHQQAVQHSTTSSTRSIVDISQCSQSGLDNYYMHFYLRQVNGVKGGDNVFV